MKLLWVLMMILCSSVAYGQKDSVMCLSKPEILILANKIQLLQDSSKYKSSIISAQDKLIGVYSDRVSLFEQQLMNREQTLDLVNRQNDQLKRQIEHLTPKWYDDNRLWFGAGVLTTVIVFIATR
jgi:hypothetical protein